MDDDFIDLLVISSVAGIGFVALTYLVTKIYSDKIRIRMLCLKRKTKHFIVVPNIIAASRSRSILSFQKFNATDEMHTENSGKILTCLDERSSKQSTKRVRIKVEAWKDKLESRSSSNSSKVERLAYALVSSAASASVRRRKTL